MAEEENLKLAKAVVRVKTFRKRLPQGDDVWEADFQVQTWLPSIMETARKPLRRSPIPLPLAVLSEAHALGGAPSSRRTPRCSGFCEVAHILFGTESRIGD